MAEEITAPKTEPPKSGYDVYLDERKALVDAARESARTFDKAILTFASAAFGFSIAFLKEAAPHPSPQTLIWLKLSWGMFTFSLVAIMLSFLFSHQACSWAIIRTFDQLVVGRRPKPNPWARATNILNYLAVGLLFCGISFWGIFVFANLQISEERQPLVDRSSFEKGFTPPPAPKQDRPMTPPATPPVNHPPPSKSTK